MNRRRVRVATAAFAISVAIGSTFEGGSAFADSLPQIWGHGGKRTIDVGGETASRGKAGTVVSTRDHNITVVVPACDGNQPTLSAPREAMCVQASTLCLFTPDPRDAMFWYYSATLTSSGSPGSWRRTGQACLRPELMERSSPRLTVTEFRRLPLPAGQIHVQPDSGRNLVNMPTNVYVDAVGVTLQTRLVGFPVRVRAAPVAYAWVFGDGESLTTSDPGAAFPDMRTTHTYQVAGSFAVRLATTYRGEYSVSGGPWVPVQGYATVPSPTVVVDVVEVRGQLVADSSSGLG